MEPCARQAAHQAWAAGRAQVIVATVAFGMGINKPDVRFVVHASLSKSVENYYQESGRAGRDGLFARCLLFYRFSDALRQAAIVCYEPNWWSHLSAMARYASSLTGCRRAALQAHFAEFPAPCPAMCDCCSRQPAAPCSRTAAAAEGRGTAAAAAGTEAEADGGREAGVGGSCPGGQQGGGGAGGGRLLQPALVLQDVGGEVLSALKALHQLRTGGSKKVTLVQLMAGWRKADKAAAKRLSREQQEQVQGGVGAYRVVEAMLLRWEVLELEFGATAYATNVYLKPSSQGQAMWQPGDPEPCMEGKFCMHFRPDMEEGGAVEGGVALQQQQQQQRGVDQGKGDVALQAGASGVLGEGEVLPSGRQGGKRSGSSSRGGKGGKQQRKEGGGVQAPGEVVWVDTRCKALLGRMPRRSLLLSLLAAPPSRSKGMLQSEATTAASQLQYPEAADAVSASLGPERPHCLCMLRSDWPGGELAGREQPDQAAPHSRRHAIQHRLQPEMAMLRLRSLQLALQPLGAPRLPLPLAPALPLSSAAPGLLLQVHTLAVDPEMTNLSSYMNEDQTGIAARGTKYNDDVAHMFRERVAKHKFGVFNNAGN
ncbi:hypothetical protein QJQ45_020622 [Haematococcus lacustris]|nr:hypothetical protein QJQ45_020622 [Haematococcus lacustris]